MCKHTAAIGCGTAAALLLLVSNSPHVERSNALGPDSPWAREKPRKFYPYSVISGGAHTREELAASRKKDPVVADHFARFRPDRVHVLRLRAEEHGYVSFRIQDRIFWTRKPVRLPAGETLIGDGSNYARTRCGNRVSATPQQPTTPDEPPERVLNTPDISAPAISVSAEVPSRPEVRANPEIPTAIPQGIASTRQQGNAPLLTAPTRWSSQEFLFSNVLIGPPSSAAPAAMVVDQIGVAPEQWNDNLFSNLQEMPEPDVIDHSVPFETAILPVATSEMLEAISVPAPPATQSPGGPGSALPAPMAPATPDLNPPEQGSGLVLFPPFPPDSIDFFEQPPSTVPDAPAVQVPVSVPEPATTLLVLLGAGFVIIAGFRHRRRSHALAQRPPATSSP